MVGENVRKIRVIKGYSQQYMAVLLEISQAAYSDIETGKTRISLDKLQKIVLILNLELSYVVNFHENSILCSNPNNLMRNEGGINEVKTHFDKERALYKEQINTLKDEIVYLRNKLDGKE
ncbi:helix-turn-helix transcriptional regulator [Flavobacterium sp. Fl-318]|uniref:Helix-turn-helix transcriptional regulator n=1 Tax=Flavobacterium cupriresistens TaxID=2893885 RepID=A0ABU4RL91_9FLAO|nr:MULTISPECIES: helix-turn-helix transcriptional regulator [unclassified Flavobacterium]MDX6192150.1 helix-turn-helix transcriptional regulator [Flavobacterium sp. Fl-318]UFH41896.1 helix-turn-helix domain-containing protein [Flavobacterium sp. F-323]